MFDFLELVNEENTKMIKYLLAHWEEHDEQTG